METFLSNMHGHQIVCVDSNVRVRIGMDTYHNIWYGNIFEAICIVTK